MVRTARGWSHLGWSRALSSGAREFLSCLTPVTSTRFSGCSRAGIFCASPSHVLACPFISFIPFSFHNRQPDCAGCSIPGLAGHGGNVRRSTHLLGRATRFQSRSRNLFWRADTSSRCAHLLAHQLNRRHPRSNGRSGARAPASRSIKPSRNSAMPMQ
jgi:hypothetical protein